MPPDADAMLMKNMPDDDAASARQRALFSMRDLRLIDADVLICPLPPALIEDAMLSVVDAFDA